MPTAATAQQTDHNATIQAPREPALPFRGDTLLGVCEAVGQDLGFNPTWLRAAFAALLLWNPEVVVACYVGLGIVVALTRWAFPISKTAAIAEPKPAAANAPVADSANADEKELLAA